MSRSLFVAAFALLAAPLFGQQPAAGRSPTETQISDSIERIGENHVKRIGHVELISADSALYADEVEFFQDQNRAIATGNVVLAQANSRIAADRAEFNTETRLGTFHHAWGIATLQPGRQGARPGAPPLAVAGQDTDVYFYGDMVEKVGPKKYRITNGGFTTCVQPTPRWQLSSTTIVLNLDHYTIFRNAVFSVKGVPMLYTPFLYYPTKREDRATGFLLPTYGASTIRGQSIHNAFFWAIDRSQDATFMHDWFTNTGQGLGSEYRYNFGAGSDGNIRTYWLDERNTTFVDAGGQTSTLPATRSYEIRGSANQLLPHGFRARANVNYFSSVVTMQTLNTNIYDASRNQRSFGGNLVGVSNGFSMNGTIDHSEYFYSNTNSSAITGNWPRVNVSRNEQPLFGSQFYYSFGTEYAHLLRTNIVDIVESESGVTRFDVTPQVRYPFKKWQWFTVNSTIGWRDTYYTRSKDLTGAVVDEGVDRRFFAFRSQLLGPVFTRVWNTPDNGYAEKFKHTIEPYLNINRTSSIDNFDRIVQLDGTDAIVGGTTSYTYGLNNRFYAKRRPSQNSPIRISQAREILDIEVSQSYYTDQRAALYDLQYATSFSGAAPNNFSPVALSVRTLPTDQVNATMRAEFDSRYRTLRTISASGTYTVQNRLSTTVSWSKRALIPELPGFDNPASLDQYVTLTTNIRTRDNRFGGLYSFNYDVLRSTMLQQRLTGFYNAQCCGLAFEYQTYNLAGTSLAIPADRRFFISFTLAGLGNFSPFNGAMGGIPR